MKKFTRRFISVIMVLIMVMSMFVVLVSAEGGQNTEFSVSVSGNVAVGEKISLIIGLKNANSLEWATIDFVYDADCMEFVKINEVESGDLIFSEGKNVSGSSRNNIFSMNAISGDTDFAILTLKILDLKNTEFSVSAPQWGPDVSSAPSTAIFDLSEIVSTGEFVDPAYKYKIENGEVTITDCNLDIAGDIIIPDTIDGYPVTVIGEHAFSGCNEIISIVIPDSVKTIEKHAFSGIDGLINATIGAGVTNLGENIFWACDNLENVVIKDGVTYISQEMFSQCGKLKNVSIPQSVTAIGEKAFQFCYLLENIELPDKLTTIEQSTFYMCQNLKNIVIPDSVTKICNNAFYGCMDLANVKLPKNLKEIEYNAFADCGLTSIDIPESVTSIGDGAFAGTKLKSLELPPAVTVINRGTFQNCENLKDIIIPKTVKIIQPYAFYDCDNLQSVVIPANVTEVWGEAFGTELAPKGVTVYGIKGSAAQTHADNNWYIMFVELKESDFNFDVNSDGKVTAEDARLTLRASAMLENLSGIATLAADVDANGKITAEDARLILRRSAGLE